LVALRSLQSFFIVEVRYVFSLLWLFIPNPSVKRDWLSASPLLQTLGAFFALLDVYLDGAKMGNQRVFKSSNYMQVSYNEPIRSIVDESEHSVIVAWHVESGQTIAPHTHPNGQDTWTILSGEGQYQIGEAGNTVSVISGDVVVAKKGQIHGVLCTSKEPLRFISVVAPFEAGYLPLTSA
jgi:quercetin dioxygenase-like cupin family protein